MEYDVYDQFNMPELVRFDFDSDTHILDKLNIIVNHEMNSTYISINPDVLMVGMAIQ